MLSFCIILHNPHLNQRLQLILHKSWLFRNTKLPICNLNFLSFDGLIRCMLCLISDRIPLFLKSCLPLVTILPISFVTELQDLFFRFSLIIQLHHHISYNNLIFLLSVYSCPLSFKFFLLFSSLNNLLVLRELSQLFKNPTILNFI